MSTVIKQTMIEVVTDTHEQTQFSVLAGKSATLLLSNEGMIVGVNEEGARLLDYSLQSTDRLHVSQVLPGLAKTDLLEKGEERVSPYFRFLSRIGYHFKIIAMNGREFSAELYFSDLSHGKQHQILILIYPVQEENR
jgi:nitrogen-specific signal transduction histidine kinase